MDSPRPRGRTLALLAVLVCVAAGCLAPAEPGDGGATSASATAPAEATVTAGTTAAQSAATSSGATTATARAPSTPNATATPHPETSPAVRATVVDVIDGDTLRVRYPNGTRDTVRLLGVDTPEIFSENEPGEYEGVPETDAGRACLRRYGEAAEEYARERLAGRTVRLGFDSLAGRRGFYDRLLAYVYVDGEQFNYALLDEGYARFYESRFHDRERYEAAENRARAAERGLWSCADATGDGATTDAATTDAGSTGDATASGTPIAVSVHADAAGDDRENLNDEYVVVRNVGNATLDLSGWTISEGDGRRYEFAAGTTLDPGEEITVRTGSGRDAATDRYWGSGAPVWNNGGDEVTVTDADGDVVLSESY